MISVRDKVINELRSVLERVNHDARASISLEYSIKMIVNNQLNDQDFGFKSQALEESSEE